MEATDVQVQVRQDPKRSRLDDLIAGADASGFTIDYLEALTSGLSGKARRKVIDNMASLPAEMKAIDNRHIRRRKGF